MWTVVGMGLVRLIPLIVDLVEKHSAETKDPHLSTAEPATISGPQKLDLALNIANLVMQTMANVPGGATLEPRKRDLLVKHIESTVELLNAWSPDHGELER